jgi:hypothetical protein
VALAFVLPEEVAGNGPVTFPGFPGVWTPGQPIEAAAFVAAGVADTETELDERRPPQLERVDVAAGSHPLPARPNHVPSAEEAAAAPKLEKMSHDELDTRARTLGLAEFPAKTTRAVKIEAIEAAMSAGEEEL